MDLNKQVSLIMKNNFDLQKHETSILVVTDDSTARLATEFFHGLQNDGWNAQLAKMTDRHKSGEEPTNQIAEEMLNHQLVFCLTKHSLTHTNARRNANEHGVQVVTMPGVTKEMFTDGALNADYSIVEKETIAMTEKIQNATAISIYTDENCKLYIPIGNREAIASTGVFKEKGASGNLPSGEAYVAPIEHKAHGEVMINGSMSGIGLLEEPVKLVIKDGRLEEAIGKQGDQLLALLGEVEGRYLAELGIGTNYAAKVIGNILEDEKAYNTIHVAFGSNHTFGGTIKANVHIDCVTVGPKIKFHNEMK